MIRRLLITFCVVLFLAVGAHPDALAGTATSGENHTHLDDLSLEELMDLEITSVARKPQKVSEAAAAVFVITQEDIRRSGATTIPEILRMAPGLQIARINANKWAVSSRGFNEQFSTKLLVLLDGRTIYNPLFTGVDWESQDVMLEDIERIEVIRGPGATLWGANAVNGVINIISKNAQETQGTLASAGYGSEERGFGAVRYGDMIGENAYYRTYVKFADRDESYEGGQLDPDDDWEMWRGGFRFDQLPHDGTELTLQGELYAGDVGEEAALFSLEQPYSIDSKGDKEEFGAYVLARASRLLASLSQYSLQVYYDHNDRDTLLNRQRQHVIDTDFQYAFTHGDRHEVVWGLGYRLTLDDMSQSEVLSFDSEHRRDQLFSAFLQDEIVLGPDVLSMMLGSKIEHNDYSGFEIQPNVRFLFTPGSSHTIWTSVARAVRTPSRAEHDAEFMTAVLGPGEPLNPFPLPVALTSSGDEDFESEKLIAYEAGYRFQGSEWFHFDIATFYYRYHDLRTVKISSLEVYSDAADPYISVDSTGDNNADGYCYGVDSSIDLQVRNWWRMQISYSYLQVSVDFESENDLDELIDEPLESREGYTPHHQVSIRSLMSLSPQLEADLWLRYVDNLSDLDIPSYVSMDLRLGWRISDAVEISLVGQNLLDNHHPEFPGFEQILIVAADSAEIERGYYGKITLRF
ncbi:MAG TPA: TonB-dependent receptor [Thermodesulfobacteriota bacterium]|nr:TonB-dependent receptor [Deltaproteobacteria bacterium]HNR14050.1 TonB-dependent receptor [Thermodesulfobacteriota bacterium]HNU70453.1 TonB-dependent receptor [Thermodesulfobacteriota bacterium]HOC38691.1 TonB-dependent receptor [Thermodesulfobacteriota bacterium]